MCVVDYRVWGVVMNKKIVLLIALLVVSVGFLGGCTQQSVTESDTEAKNPYKYNYTTSREVKRTCSRCDGIGVIVHRVYDKGWYMYDEYIECPSCGGWGHVYVTEWYNSDTKEWVSQRERK